MKTSEQKRAYDHNYYYTHREELLNKQRQYKQNRSEAAKEKTREQKRKDYLKHHEERRAKARECYHRMSLEKREHINALKRQRYWKDRPVKFGTRRPKQRLGNIYHPDVNLPSNKGTKKHAEDGLRYPDGPEPTPKDLAREYEQNIGGD